MFLKTMRYKFLLLLPLLFAVSCNRVPAPVGCALSGHEDHTDYATVAINAEFPIGDSPVEAAIRDTLLSRMYGQWSHVGISDASDSIMPRYSGDFGGGMEPVIYYTRSILGYLSALSAEDHAASGRADIVPWEYRNNLDVAFDTDNFIVFHDESYFYMGGAHGGVSGNGYMTFDKRTGALFTDFLKPGAVQDLQPLIIEGIQSYYASCGEPLGEQELRDRLFLDGDLIPLPSDLPGPAADGLHFVYQQYEIACYADGMVSFTIPYDRIEPYLTPAAKQLLGIGRL